MSSVSVLWQDEDYTVSPGQVQEISLSIADILSGFGSSYFNLIIVIYNYNIYHNWQLYTGFNTRNKSAQNLRKCIW